MPAHAGRRLTRPPPSRIKRATNSIPLGFSGPWAAEIREHHDKAEAR
jgi:hypothetical protein